MRLVPSSLGCFVYLLAGAVAWGQVSAGPEFLVNTYTFGDQRDSVVAATPGGDFMVAWTGETSRVPIQRFDASGARLGGEFQVNTYTLIARAYSAVADSAGNYVVAWQANPDIASDAFARRFGADGVPRGPEFRLNTYTTGDQRTPRLAVGPGGSLVAAWSSTGQDGSVIGVYAQRYDGNGVPIGAEFMVNTYTTGQQDAPETAISADGRFVIAWRSFGEDGSNSGVFAQRYDAGGNRVGGPFQVNTYTTGGQVLRSMSMAPDGRFVVAWDGQDGSVLGVFARRFDAAGEAVGAEFTVNTFIPGNQMIAGVAIDASGRFVAVWQDLERTDIFVQRFTAAGIRRGDEFRVNTYTTGNQRFPSVGSDEVGNFVVIWNSYGQDGSVWGVFSQRFGGLHPRALAVDTAGNGVWEPGEQVDVRPTWRNSSGGLQTFAADLSGLAGPPGATYVLVDGTGSYGDVADGVNAPCVDCYVVGVNSPASRPALDWDATAAETLTPDLHGQRKVWRLHIGASFTDVPPGGTFYGFVETLLHRGVTAGCGPSVYCPAASTTREQMAVFLLLAKEPAGYAPPACTTPVFADVPASSVFCRWIEELARRGVTGGCAPNLYCPAAAVTREQMAVFLLRTLDPTLTPPACAPPNVFNDVPETSAFCPWIEELARRGITGGCGDGNYCPTAAVTREQMAPFLTVTFGLTLYGP